MVQELLRIREENLDRTDPIYSLIHSPETETAVQTAHHLIKLELLEQREAQSDATGEQSSITSNVEKENVDPPIFKCLEGEFTKRIL